MNTENKIIQLFKSLPNKEKQDVLKVLNKISTNEAMPSKDMLVSSCPNSKSKLFTKNGYRGAYQKYKCKSCFRVFTAKTGTSLHGLHKPEKFQLYKSLMLEAYYPIKTIANKVGVSIQTAFDWRHKILTGVNKDNKLFEGITEIDDVWFSYSQKGRKGLKHSKKRGGNKGVGDNEFQVKLLITADRNKTIDMSLACIGRLTKADIERKISGRFSKGCVLVSDKHRSIAAFAKSEKLKHISFKAAQHTAGGEYHVQNINNMAQSLKGTINYTLKGVSTKYLQNYATWYQIMRRKTNPKELRSKLLKNKKATQLFVNREGIYEWFIENLSKRTYRCPVKKTYQSAVDQEDLVRLSLI